MTATAHSQKGVTAAGTISRRGTVAADPKILPMGSRIRVANAGAYSGVYSVEDTGPRVNGHKLDIFMATAAEARRFGRKRVRVTVLKYGEADVKAAAAK
jgi:rare lipoprotein A